MLSPLAIAAAFGAMAVLIKLLEEKRMEFLLRLITWEEYSETESKLEMFIILILLTVLIAI